MKPRSNPIPPKSIPAPTPEQRKAADTAKIRDLVRKVWGKP